MENHNWFIYDKQTKVIGQIVETGKSLSVINTTDVLYSSMLNDLVNNEVSVCYYARGDFVYRRLDVSNTEKLQAIRDYLYHTYGFRMVQNEKENKC